MHALHTPSTARTPLHNYILHHVHNYYIMNERLAHHVNHPLQLILRNDCVPYWSYMSAFMTFIQTCNELQFNLIPIIYDDSLIIIQSVWNPELPTESHMQISCVDAKDSYKTGSHKASWWLKNRDCGHVGSCRCRCSCVCAHASACLPLKNRDCGS